MFDLDCEGDRGQEKTPDEYTLAGLQFQAYCEEYDAMLEKYKRNEPVNIERAEFLQAYLIKNGVALYDRISWDW